MNEKTLKTTDDQALRNADASNLSVPSNQRYIDAATSDNTRRTYQAAIRHFENWGGLLPANEAMVIRYLLDHADSLKPSTLSLRLTALRQWHRLQKFTDPTDGADIRKTMKGIERVHGKPKRKAKVFSLEHLGLMITGGNGAEHLKDTRDRALLLVGFFGAFRRSELVALEVEHLDWVTEGVTIMLPRSKTDQTGEGKTKSLPRSEDPLCAVSALQQWLELSEIKSGPVFRGITRWNKLKPKALTPASVNLILKFAATQAGLDFVPDLSSHSLRRSLATGAHRSGASFESIKRQGGWSHDATVWGYIEEAQQFEDNAVTKLLSKAKQNKDET